jgi:hypothetical protein
MMHVSNESKPPRSYTTDEAAAILGVKPHTLRVGLCTSGEYMGLRPVKLPNRRLLWPADLVDGLARGETPKAGTADQAA